MRAIGGVVRIHRPVRLEGGRQIALTEFRRQLAGRQQEALRAARQAFSAFNDFLHGPIARQAVATGDHQTAQTRQRRLQPTAPGGAGLCNFTHWTFP